MSAKALDPHPVPALAFDPPRADAWSHQPRRAPRLHGGDEYPRAATARWISYEIVWTGFALAAPACGRVATGDPKPTLRNAAAALGSRSWTYTRRSVGNMRPVGLERMLRIHFLQQWYAQSGHSRRAFQLPERVDQTVLNSGIEHLLQ